MAALPKPHKRKDYLKNIKARTHTGCTWCGCEVPQPVSTATYCSDACVQADHEGMDDLPPVLPLSPGSVYGRSLSHFD